MGNRWEVHGYQWDDYSGWYYAEIFAGDSFEHAYQEFVWATYTHHHAKLEFRG